MLIDFKYAIRQLLKNPGFASFAIIILAIGIGASIALAAFIYALFIRPLHLRNPQQLVLVSTIGGAGSRSISNNYLSYPVYEQFRDRSQTLAGLVAVASSHRSMIASNLARSGSIDVRSSEVSGNFFSVLGLQASMGRVLSSDDDQKGAPHEVAVLSYAFWQRIFGKSGSVLGKTVIIDNVPITIVGIAQPRFSGVTGYTDDLWMPIQLLPLLEPASGNSLQSADEKNLFVLGRLRSGLKREAANAELNVIFQALV